MTIKDEFVVCVGLTICVGVLDSDWDVSRIYDGSEFCSKGKVWYYSTCRDIFLLMCVDWVWLVGKGMFESVGLVWESTLVGCLFGKLKKPT